MKFIAKIFPNTIVQSILLLLGSLFLCSPLFFLPENTPEILKISIHFSFYCAVVLVVVFFINKKRKVKINYNFKLSKGAVDLLPILVIIIVSFQIGITFPITKMLDEIFNFKYDENSFPIYFLVSTLILSPIIEEVVFRGVILRGLATSFVTKKAIIISALIFGIPHFSTTMPFAILLGLFFGWAYLKFSQSITLTILLHFVANLSGLFAMFLAEKYGAKQIASTTDIYGDYSMVIILTALCMFIISSWFLYKKGKTI